MKITGRSLLLGVLVAALAVPGLAAAQEVHAQRVKVEVLPPKTPETQEACATEYGEVNFAYKKLIAPSVDEEVAKKVLDRAWMPDPNIRLFGGGRAETPPPITDAPAPSAATNAPAPPATTPPAK